MRDVAEALLALAGGGDAAPEGLVAGARLVRKHGLAPLARVVLRRAGEASASCFEADFTAAVANHLRTLAGVRELQVVLEDLPWAVVKGPVLSELAHPVPGTRPYADLDVLVAPDRLGDVVERLQAEGWQLLDRNHRLVLARMPGEVHLLSPEGLQLDVHWHVVNAARRRLAVDLPTAPLLERRALQELRGLQVPCLERTDALHHLCVHAAGSGADRLLWLLDVDQWVRRAPVDWSSLVARARRACTGPALALVLGRAQRLLGTPVPGTVLRGLPGGLAWTGLDAALVGRVRLVRGAAPGRVMARAARRGAGRSAVELLLRSRNALRGSTTPASSWDGETDDVAWAEFLRRVAREH